jgi:hypothetical protein
MICKQSDDLLNKVVKGTGLRKTYLPFCLKVKYYSYNI